MSQIFSSIRDEIKDLISGGENLVENTTSSIFNVEKHSHTHLGEACGHLHTSLPPALGGTQPVQHRFESFAPESEGDVKWFVDGCGYFWAVSVALEEAKEEIWILDWWLSPELYLRRPPSANENYRLDRMLKAAAERGVKVNVIVYKEVTQALTTCSYHSKHALENLHPNICVFRHPDHLPDGQVFESEMMSKLKNMSLGIHELAALPGDGLKALYGVQSDVILYWAHHEKLLLVDRKLAFMGGLDLCFGRWDTNDHPIVDAHPNNLDDIVFPGQDFNNARIYDFQDVTHWKENKLDRTKSSRMGWSDCSISLQGPICNSLTEHFVTRWNFIFNEKYNVREDVRYSALTMNPSAPSGGMRSYLPGGNENERPSQQGGYHFGQGGGMFDSITRGFHHLRGDEEAEMDGTPQAGNIPIQLVRSCTKWSHGVPTEHSICSSYIDTIRDSKHFVYIENQFFITATSDEQDPVKNKIGAAIVERILRAAQNGEKYKMIVCMPAVPAFAGDLHDDSSLGTRAIMEYQYSSICRGGHSIMEKIQEAGVNPEQYIRFYNLRNYDRINTSGDLKSSEQQSGVDYETARKEHDDKVGAGYDGYGEETGVGPNTDSEEYDRYQQGARETSKGSGKWDSISEAYMLNGTPVTSIPWSEGNESEIDAFVSEELYIHSKILIADDRTVICGSANLNDRSQLGYHDSEIAVVIQDPRPVQSQMAGESWTASKFAASLRRQIFRKHIGLLPYQDFTKPTHNFLPINKAPNTYDWNSTEDLLVADPLSPEFEKLWSDTAATNTFVFSKAFHCVPADNVRNWDEYKSFFSAFFVGEGDKDENGKQEKPPKYEYGHVVREEFAEGEEGVRECKELLGRVRGMLVEMPLHFLEGVDMAKEGLSFNGFTAEVYT